MATALRPIGHEDRLSLVEHLDELRSRLLICAAALIVSFSFCFWQNDAILELLNRPLEQTQNLDGAQRSNDPLEQAARFNVRLGAALSATAPALRDLRASIDQLAASADLTPAQRSDLRRRSASLDRAVRQIQAAADAVPTNRKRQPVTLGPAEPFTTTISVALYSAALLVLQVLLYQLFAFLLPAFSPSERRVALPLMTMVPLLFLGGVAFAYLVVLPRAVDFLQNFNDDSFDILLQARDYYRFAIVFMGGVGLLFLMPIAILGITRTGIVTPRQLRANRGYVILGISVLCAVATPTPDPITMTLAMGPLIVLFELSILLAAWMDRRDRRRQSDEQGEKDEPGGEPDAGEAPVAPARENDGDAV
jgi:sec-independent protein translocase protein TatC